MTAPTLGTMLAEVAQPYRQIDRIVAWRGGDFGGKARGLASLARAGLPVPSAYALDTSVCRAHLETTLEESELPEAVFARASTPRATLMELMERVRQAPLPAEAEDALRGVITGLKASGADRLAVRSSSSFEDQRSSSGAGLAVTVLDCLDEESVFAAAREAFASLYDPAVWAYLRNARARQAPRMGLVVQAMVPAEAAGVIFTANPLTGDAGEVVINASYGLGESVVDGLVAPDTYRIDKATGVTRERVLGDKRIERVLVGDGETREGPVERVVPVARRDRPCLADEMVARLADMAIRAEDRLGGPQDLEFAIAGDRIWLLRAWSRPTPGRSSVASRSSGFGARSAASAAPCRRMPSSWARFTAGCT